MGQVDTPGYLKLVRKEEERQKEKAVQQKVTMNSQRQIQNTRREFLIAITAMGGVTIGSMPTFLKLQADRSAKKEQMEAEKNARIERVRMVERRLMELCTSYGIGVRPYQSADPKRIVLCIELPVDSYKTQKAEEHMQRLDDFVHILEFEGMQISRILMDEPGALHTLKSGAEVESVQDVETRLMRHDDIPAPQDSSMAGRVERYMHVINAEPPMLQSHESSDVPVSALAFKGPYMVPREGHSEHFADVAAQIVDENGQGTDLLRIQLSAATLDEMRSVRAAKTERVAKLGNE